MRGRLAGIVLALAFALCVVSPAGAHHCGRRCHERLAEQCAKQIVGGARC